MSDRVAGHRIPSTPFEDARAYLRRWRGYEPGDVVPRADLPVFVADHVPLADRREGSVAFFCDGIRPGRLRVAVVPDGPAEPTDAECLTQVSGFLTRVAGGEESVDLDGQGLGLVLHRGGPARVTDLDRRWRRAVDDGAASLGLRVLGVCARTWSGALVAVPLSAASPRDEGIACGRNRT